MAPRRGRRVAVAGSRHRSARWHSARLTSRGGRDRSHAPRAVLVVSAVRPVVDGPRAVDRAARRQARRRADDDPGRVVRAFDHAGAAQPGCESDSTRLGRASRLAIRRAAVLGGLRAALHRSRVVSSLVSEPGRTRRPATRRGRGDDGGRLPVDVNARHAVARDHRASRHSRDAGRRGDRRRRARDIGAERRASHSSLDGLQRRALAIRSAVEWFERLLVRSHDHDHTKPNRSHALASRSVWRALPWRSYSSSRGSSLPP